MIHRLRARMRSTAWWPVLVKILAPVMPGWPDEARRIVQAPVLRALLTRVHGGLPIPRRVLNAGAGEGLFSDLLLAVPGVEMVIEMDVSYAAYRRQLSDGRQRALAASVTTIPLDDESVEVVMLSEVLEHVVDDAAALDELRRVLRVGGWLLVSVPIPPAVFDPNHVREGYTPSELTAMLVSRGWDVVDSGFCMRAAFRLLLRTWRRRGRMTRFAIRTLGYLDRMCPVGRPMDLVVIAQRRASALVTCGPRRGEQ